MRTAQENPQMITWKNPELKIQRSSKSWHVEETGSAVVSAEAGLKLLVGEVRDRRLAPCEQCTF